MSRLTNDGDGGVAGGGSTSGSGSGKGNGMPTRLPPRGGLSRLSVDSVTVTRTAKVWRNDPKRGSMVMALPKDVVELVGLKSGDAVIVTGNADGTMTIVRADSIGIGVGG